MAAYVRVAASADTPEITIGADNLLGVTCNQSASIIGAEMAVDDAVASILAEGSVNIGVFVPADADGLLTSDGELLYCGVDESILPEIPHGTRFDVYADTDFLVGVYYVDTVTRITKQVWELHGISAFGLLEEVNHPGGMYARAPLATVLSEIIGGRFQYSIDPALNEEGKFTVSGWLPYEVARTNLHTLCLAQGIAMSKDASGQVYFTLADASNPTIVPENEVYTGGRSTYPTPASKAEVTEWSYFQPVNATSQILYDNTDGSNAAVGSLITFDSPHYNLAASGGLTIDSYGVNYAIVTGIGTLTGIPYARSQRVVRVGSGQGRTVSVSNNGLVNGLNSYNLAKRLLSYYSGAAEASGKIILTAPMLRPGQPATIPDAFNEGESNTGLISQMRVNLSAKTAGNYTLVTGYTPDPADAGNAVTRRVIITENGTWTVPAGVTRIRIMLIGGGSGGQGGYSGAAGYDDLTYYSHYYPGVPAYEEYQYYTDPHDTGGVGGDAGAAGQAGKVLVLDLDVTPGQSASFAIGAGGVGGAAEGGDGTSGTPTTMTSDDWGNRTSDTGAIPQNGISDIVDGTVYSAPGVAGTKGGDGGTTSQTDPTARQGRGYPGGNAGEYSGGSGGGGAGDPGTYIEGNTLYAAGGGGGGAAFGSVGEAGGSARVRYSVNASSYGGNGGDGADASAPALPAYGCGGGGGNGGGGGGNAGGAYNYGGSVSVGKGTAGAGGAGSIGGDGGAGAVVIYY